MRISKNALLSLEPRPLRNVRLISDLTTELYLGEEIKCLWCVYVDVPSSLCNIHDRIGAVLRLEHLIVSMPRGAGGKSKANAAAAPTSASAPAGGGQRTIQTRSQKAGLQVSLVSLFAARFSKTNFPSFPLVVSTVI